jgi:hypothetical protein
MPEWIKTCVETVRRWAAGASFEYEFIPLDAFLTDAPSWLRDQCGETLIHPVLDYARVSRAAKYLDVGWHRAVWLDADMLVTRPDRLRLAPPDTAAFMAEKWTLWSGTQATVKRRYTNCICQFSADDAFTSKYLGVMEERARSSKPLTKSALGTDLLTAMHDISPLVKIPNVGNLSPHALAAIAAGDQSRIGMLMAETGESLYGVNICASHEGADYAGVVNDGAVYDTAVKYLIDCPDLLEYKNHAVASVDR